MRLAYFASWTAAAFFPFLLILPAHAYDQVRPNRFPDYSREELMLGVGIALLASFVVMAAMCKQLYPKLVRFGLWTVAVSWFLSIVVTILTIN